ncbi:MAG: hypothetical protein ACRDEB_01590 [Chitinophagaceae bacterium]
MKKIMVIMAGIIMLACNDSKNKSADKKVKYSDLANDLMKGDIQSIEEMPYKTDSSGKIGDMDTCCIEVTEFDVNGNAVKFVSKNSKGTIKNESDFIRHENGLWIGSKGTKEGGKLDNSMKVGVDDKGIYTIAEAFDTAGKLEFYYTNITQNEQGSVLTWKQYDKDSVFRAEGESKYDKGLQTSFVLKDSVGKTKSSNATTYNEKGETTERSNTTYKNDSATTKVTKYTYETHDDMGNWTQRTEWDDKGKAVKIVKRNYSYLKKEDKK